MPFTLRSLLFLLLIIAQAVVASTTENLVNNPERVIPVINAHSKQQSISRNGLSAIFKMRLHQWRDGTAVTVFVLKDDNPLHKRFCKEILNVFPSTAQSVEQAGFQRIRTSPNSIKQYRRNAGTDKGNARCYWLFKSRRCH